MKTFIYFSLTIFFFNLNINSYASIRVSSPPDSADCTMNLSLYYEFFIQKDYKSAMPYWRFVFKNCPEKYQRIYKDGAVMYRDFIEKESIGSAKEKLCDTLILIHEQHMEYFGDNPKYPSGQIWRDIGIDLLNYRPTEVDKAYKAFKTSMELMGENCKGDVLQYLIKLAVEKNNNGSLSKEDAFSDYLRCSEITDKRIKIENEKGNTESVEKLKNMKKSIETQFMGSKMGDCENILPFIEQRFRADSGNADVLIELITILNNKKCTESSLYMRIIKQYTIIEPSPISWYLLATSFTKKSMWTEANNAYNEAIRLETDHQNKAKLLLEQAGVLYNLKQYEKARDKAQEAARLMPEWGRPYILLANIYKSCINSCGNKDYYYGDVYWIVVDMLIKAKTIEPDLASVVNPDIAACEQQFPTKEVVFFGVGEGNPYTIGCWIKETTVARSRK